MTAPPRSAMVLAAGRGTRLMPVTHDRPKALVEVGGRTLLDHQLDRLAAARCARTVVNMHHYADRVEAHLAQRKGPPKILASDERDALMDTGGALVKARTMLGEAPFFVMNCDALWSDVRGDPFASLQHRHEMAKAPAAVLLLAKKSRALGLQTRGDFALDADGRLRRPQPGEEVPYYYAGTQLLSPACLDGFESRPFSANLIWDRAMAQEALFGVVLDGFWMHVGDPNALEEVQARLQQEPLEQEA